MKGRASPIYITDASLSSSNPVTSRRQVDLRFLRFITAIGTQGAISKETKKHYFVRSYKVDLSSNGEDWVAVKEGSKQKVTTDERMQRNENQVREFVNI